MALISARGLSKSFKGKAAVRGLSFDVIPGSVTGFLGPNGAGKSTTMRLMLGLDNGEGVTTYDGVAYRQLKEPLRHVGSVLDAKPFHPTRTAFNHLRMLAVSNNIPAGRVTEVINIVGLGDVASAKPKTFSLGMGQRLGIATALLGDPGTMILDEPANGLDPQGVHWLRNLLKSLAQQGRSVFVSSHLLSEMALMADHLVVVGRGSLIASGKMSDFISTSHRNAVIVRVDDPDLFTRELRARRAAVVAEPDGTLVVTEMDSNAVGDLAHELNVRVFELSNRQATLEEAFLDATGASEEFRASMGLGPGAAMGGGGFGMPPGVGPPPSFGQSPAGYGGPGQGYGPPPSGQAPPQGYGPPPGAAPLAYGPPRGFPAPGQEPDPGQVYGPTPRPGNAYGPAPGSGNAYGPLPGSGDAYSPPPGSSNAHGPPPGYAPPGHGYGPPPGTGPAPQEYPPPPGPPSPDSEVEPDTDVAAEPAPDESGTTGELGPTGDRR